MEVYVKETLHVLDYNDNIKDAIFISDDHRTAGYAYNITLKEANTGYSDLTFEMPNTIISEDGTKIKNPKLKLLTPLVKLRYRREVYYTGEKPIVVRVPVGLGDQVEYIDKIYSNVYPENIIEDYVMDYIVQPVDKKRNVLQISTTFTAMDYPRFNLSKKRVGMAITQDTLTRDEWSLFENEPKDVPGTIKYIKWDADLSQDAGNPNIPTTWDPENAKQYPLEKENIEQLMRNETDWPYGVLATAFYWPITSTARFNGVMYKEGGYLVLQLYDFYNLTTEGIDPNLYIDRYSWDWTQLYEVEDYLCPNNARNYLSHILEGTNWTVGDVDITKTTIHNPRDSRSTEEVDKTCNINITGGNCYNAITAVCQGLQLYPKFDCINRVVSLKEFSGYNYGLFFSLGHNIKDDSTKADGEKVITKLYCTGGKDYNGDADINIGPAVRSTTQTLNGFYNDAGDLPTDEVSGYWAIVDPDMPDSAFYKTTYEMQNSGQTATLTEVQVPAHDTHVANYWNAGENRKVYFYDNTTNTWSEGTQLPTGYWEGYVNGVRYIVDPTTGTEADWDPNDPMYIQMRSPYQTNYIINLKWAYQNGWITKEQILDLYQRNQQINDLNEAFVDKYIEDYRNTRQLYNEAVNEYDIAQDEYESTLYAMENKYYNKDGMYSEGYTYCFHRAPQGTISQYNPDKQKNTKYIKIFHCYNCGITRGVYNDVIVDPSGTGSDDRAIGQVCPWCDSDDIRVDDIYIPTYDDFTFTYDHDIYPYGTDTTQYQRLDGDYRYNPHLKGYYQRLVTTLDRQDRTDDFDVPFYEANVSLIKKIPLDKSTDTVTWVDGYTYKLNGVYVRSASGQIEVWNDSISKYLLNYGRMLDDLRTVIAMQERIKQLDELYDDWKQRSDTMYANIQHLYGDYLIEGNYTNKDQPYINLLFDEGVEASDKYSVPPITYDVNVVDSSGLIEYREPMITKYICADCGFMDYKPITNCFRCGGSTIVVENDVYNDLVKMLHSIGQIVPKAGDYVTVYDEPMGMYGVPATITEITRYPDNPIQNKITLNTSYTDDEELVGNIITATNTVLNNADIYKRTAVLKMDGTLDPDSVRESLDDASANISIVGTNGNMLLDGSGLRVTDPSDSTKAMKYAGNGIYSTSNFSTAADEAVLWEKMIGPEGINATYIRSGAIDTNKLTIMSGLSSKVIMDQYGLYVKNNTDAAAHITAFNENSAKADSTYVKNWGITNNIATFVGVDPEKNPLIYTRGYIAAEDGSNIANWITDQNGFYHLGSNNQKDLWLSPNGITGTVNDSGSQSFAIYSNGNFGVTTNGDMYSKSGKIAGWNIGSNDLYSDKVHLRSQTGDSTRAIEVNGGTFYVQNNGKMYASNADIAGKITASSGTIAGYTINNNTLKGAAVGMCGVSGEEWAFWAGAASGNDAPFKVGHDGSIYATKGNLGNCTFDNGNLIIPSGHVSGTFSADKIVGGTLSLSNGSYKSKVDSSGLYYSSESGDTYVQLTHSTDTSWGVKNALIQFASNGYNAGTIYGNELGLYLQRTGQGQTSKIGIFYNEIMLSSSLIDANNVYMYDNGTYAWISFRGFDTTARARIRADNSNLCLFYGSGGAIYAGNTGDDYKVKTAGATPSSLNVKTNLVSLDNEYDALYEDMKKVKAYNYDYKYKNVNGNLTSDYGFIIDEINNTQHLSHYFRDYDTKRAVKDNTLYNINDEDEEMKKLPKIDIKVWDTDSYIKGLFVMIKTLQHKIDQLEEQIKKEKA